MQWFPSSNRSEKRVYKVDMFFGDADMIRKINKDLLSLGRKSLPADESDIETINDLKDTLEAHRRECVGMAANMIGVMKSIIIVNIGVSDLIMINPVIKKARKPFMTEEGCLSIDGVRKVKRFMEIEVEFLDESFTTQRRAFSGFTAQIIQHETDHCSGVII